MKKAAVIPCKGIGDGLMMMVAAYALYQHGYEVTVYHPHLSSMKDWFFPVFFSKWNEGSLNELSAYEKIVIQNDNSPFLAQCKQLQQEGYPLHILYPTYEKGKHLITEKDLILPSNMPIAEGVARAMQILLQDSTLTSANGLQTKSHLTHRKHRKRVILHPTSTALDRTWSSHKFIETYHLLENQGYDPIFIVGPDEIDKWKRYQGIEVLSFPTLSELGDFIYESGFLIGNESGLSHLASNLFIPTLVIAGLKKRILQWQPGWGDRMLLYPASWIPNPKILRLRDRYWQKWISSKKVARAFLRLVALFDQLK